MQQKKILCFGEILLRMSPTLGGQWLKEAAMPVYLGGAEANVAGALAGWKLPVKYCTAMPDHYLAKEMARHLEEKGIDTSAVCWTGSRVGSYYLPQGSDLQNAGVIYDRAHSSFAGLRPGMIDWDAVLDDVSWFHFSAISPALNADVAAVCKEALEAATRKGIVISVDMNYRARLWQYGVAPVAVMPELAAYCDVIMGNLWAAESLLGIPVRKDVHAKGKEGYLEHSLSTSEEVTRLFPRCSQVAHTFRFEEPGVGLHYYASLFARGGMGAAPVDPGVLHVSTEFRVKSVVDKVGSGDCFMGGLIFGLSQARPPAETINFAAAAAFGKLQEHGDATRQTIEQVQNTIRQYAQK